MYTVDREANWSTSTLKGWDEAELSPRTYMCVSVDSSARLIRLEGHENPASRQSLELRLHQPFDFIKQVA